MQTSLTLEKDAKKLNYKELFLQLEKQELTSDRFTSLSTRVADSDHNIRFNRYFNVLPYDHTRVKLRDDSDDNLYINANYVEVPEANREYILAQGPLEYTVDRFWLMIEQLQTTTIVMLCKCYENSREKSAQYWPDEAGDTLRLDFDLEVVLLDQTKTKDFIVRNLLLTNTTTNSKRRIQHLHYVNWPDFNVPDCPQSFLDFLDTVRNSGCFEDDVGPPIVHCSAGIGRSGTFALVDSALVISEEKDISLQYVRSLLLNMRTQRMGLIQTEEQLRFSVSAILLGHSQMKNSACNASSITNGASNGCSSGNSNDAHNDAHNEDGDNLEEKVMGKRLAMKAAQDPPQPKKRKNSDS